MNRIRSTIVLAFIAILFVPGARAQSNGSWKQENVTIVAAGFHAGNNMSAPGDSAKMLNFVIQPRSQMPFVQSGVRQDFNPSAYKSVSEKPFFHVEYALPIPPAYTEYDVADLAGLDIGLGNHNHSPGLEVMPNGDLLAIYFSTPAKTAEKDTSTTFIQARLRYGAREWDLPELFFRTEGYNDQSALLWNDNGKIWFFGGGRSISDFVPFRIATSNDNGATWTFSIPKLDKRGEDFTAQPINSAFRSPDGAIYFAMDAHGGKSFLWRSTDNGISWHDMGGRTGARHSTIIPLDDKGNLLSIGGKNANINGWTPQNISHDWGQTWSESVASPFPPLGGGQRPSMIRLASGNLLYVSDAYLLRSTRELPKEWKNGKNAFVALSRDNGKTWKIRSLPEGLPQKNPEDFTSVGYTVARQSADGLIHVISTRTLPSLHFTFNEAWFWSDVDVVTNMTSEKVQVNSFTERYPDGKIKSKGKAMVCANGEYLLHGKCTDYYANGSKQHQVIYDRGRKCGRETFWNEDGTCRWTWDRDQLLNKGVYVVYWPNGKKKIESHWQLRFRPRDGKNEYVGYRAHGPSYHYDENGNLINTYMFDNGDLKDKIKR